MSRSFCFEQHTTPHLVSDHPPAGGSDRVRGLSPGLGVRPCTPRPNQLEREFAIVVLEPFQRVQNAIIVVGTVVRVDSPRFRLGHHGRRSLAKDEHPIQRGGRALRRRGGGALRRSCGASTGYASGGAANALEIRAVLHRGGSHEVEPNHAVCLLPVAARRFRRRVGCVQPALRRIQAHGLGRRVAFRLAHVVGTRPRGGLDVGFSSGESSGRRTRTCRCGAIFSGPKGT